MKNQLVSIIMPTYKRKDTIIRAVASVINQTYPTWELIIVDDGGDDGTDQLIAEKYGAEPRIHFVKNERNKGPAAARNKALSLARGEYIAFLDSDDEWLDIHLEESVQILERTGYEVSSALWSEEKNGQIINISQTEWYKESARQMAECLSVDITQDFILFQSNFFEFIINTGYYCFHINTIVMKKNVIHNIGYFDEEQGASEDMDFLYRVFETYQLLLINKEHFIYHYGKDNLYAFIERDHIYDEKNRLAPAVKDKVIYTLYNKISFFRKLKKRIKKNRTMYSKVKKSINFNILRRYLTICLLDDGTRNKHLRMHSMKYVYNVRTLRMVLEYKKDYYVSEYFCDD